MGGDKEETRRRQGVPPLRCASVGMTNLLCELATHHTSRHLDLYTLRASDSLQLAAALTWCQQRPAQRRFISGDQQLCDAAEAAGFVVIALARLGP
jgi:hypothetical protein